MSDDTIEDTDAEPTHCTDHITRRSVLRGAGSAVVGGLGGTAFATPAGAEVLEGHVGTAKTGCANGPFEATYTPGEVNVGRIRADQAKDQSPGVLGPRSPVDTSANTARSPVAADVQQPMDGEDGPLQIRSEFDGVNSLETRGGVPSDSQIAVGDGRLVHVLNRSVAIYDKRHGRREQFFRLERLFEPVTPEPEGGFVIGVPRVFDPRARYDRNHERFIIAAAQFEPGLDDDGAQIGREELEEATRDGAFEEVVETAVRPPRGWFLVAVSATKNPNGKWYVYRIPPEDASGVDNVGLVDYPRLGFDKDTIYLAQNFFDATPEFPEFDLTMVTLDKQVMYAGDTVTASHFDGMSDPDSDGLTFTLQPAQQPFSGGSDGTFYLVNSDIPIPFPGHIGTLTLWELTNPLDNPSLECITLDVDTYFPPPLARQPESPSLIQTLPAIALNADFNDGSLWTAHSTAIPGVGDRPVAAIRWYEIDVASRRIRQSGTYGTPERSTFMPTIGSEGDSTIIVHNVSGPDTYPRMDVAGRTADHTPGELEDSVIVEKGQSKYDALADEVYGALERWGDYNGFSVDPASGRFWAVSQYSPDIDIPVEEEERDPYFTRIAEVAFEEDTGRGV